MNLPDDYSVLFMQGGHPFFRDFLLYQAEQRLTEQINTLRVAAADLFLDAQLYEEAVEYLHQTQNWNRLVAI